MKRIVAQPVDTVIGAVIGTITGVALLLALQAFSVGAYAQATYTPVSGCTPSTCDWRTASSWTKIGTACNSSGAWPVYAGDINSTGCGDKVTASVSNAGVGCLGVGEICSAGTSPTTNTTPDITVSASGAKIEIGAQALFIWAGNVSVTNGSIQLDETPTSAAKWVYDCSWAASGCRTSNYSVQVTWPGVFNIGTQDYRSGYGLCNPVTPSSTPWCALLEGDSTLSPEYNATNPSACTPGAASATPCLAGGFGYNVGGSQTDVGLGTRYNYIVSDFGGTTKNSGLESFFEFTTAHSVVDINLAINNSKNIDVAQFSGAGTISWDGFSFTNGRVNSNSNSFARLVPNASAGLWSIKNADFQGGYSLTAGNAATTIAMSNVIFEGGPGANPYAYVGPFTGASDAGTKTYILYFLNSYTSGTSGAPNAIRMGGLSSQYLTYSVFWDERSYSAFNQPGAAWYHDQTGTSGSGTWVQAHNWSGSMDWMSDVPNNGISRSAARSGDNVGSLPLAVLTNLDNTDNVTGCGANGRASAMAYFTFINNSANAQSNLRMPVYGNSYCDTEHSTAGQDPSGGLGTEGQGAIDTGTIPTFNSNHLFNYYPGGDYILRVCSSTSAVVTNAWITTVTNNAASNDKYPTSYECVTNPGWLGTDSSSTTDIITSSLPNMIRGWASFPQVMDYLDTTGLLTKASLGATAWTLNTSYTAGQYVSDAQTASTVACTACAVSITGGNLGTINVASPVQVGQNVVVTGFVATYATALNGSWIVKTNNGSSITFDMPGSSTNVSTTDTGTVTGMAAWQGTTTYWLAIANCTASYKNRPVTGADVLNYWQGQVTCWEPAFMPWLRKQVLLGNPFYDGSLGIPQTGVPVIGLVNYLLRHMQISLNPNHWGGCLNGKDCGIAVPRNQRIPPPGGNN